MGLREEENKIIESINDYIKKKEELGDLGNDFTINFRDTKPLKILINLIEKQQKEIEEKNKDIKKLNDLLMLGELDYISKDKIRELIKKYQEKAEDVKQKYKGVYAYKDDYLEALAKIEGYQELLEENK